MSFLDKALMDECVPGGQALSDMPFSAQRLHVLDERCALAPAGDLAYNDAPWVPAQQGDLRFVHPKLSNQVAGCTCTRCALCRPKTLEAGHHDA